MTLKGVLDFALGNFLCLRGFARMGDLYALSEPDPGYQRDLLKLHEKEMVAFLREGEFLFYPEVILATTLSPDNNNIAEVSQLFDHVQQGNHFANLMFPDYRISCSVRKTKSKKDIRSYDIFRTATLEINANLERKFSRIDGNHRLSATPKDRKFEEHNTPFCLLLFRNSTEASRFSRALFHNINYKQIPLTMEDNLHLILDDADLFPNEKLKTNAAFGWPYYLARQLHNRLDLDLLPNLKPFIEKEPRTFLVQQFSFLKEKNVLKDKENAIKRFKEAFVKVNALFETYPSLKESSNRGLLAALVYYELQKGVPTASFIRWVLDNHLHRIEQTGCEDLIQIYDKVLESRKRSVFVSMPFGKDVTENHYKIIESACKAVSEKYNLKPEIKVHRVDWFTDGTSYVITDKIMEMIGDCGLLIGDLTFCNPNVYHEIGFIMGKAKTEGLASANILLFLDESIAEEKEKFVGFNLRGISQLRFTQTEGFKEDLQKNLEHFFKI